MSSNEALCCCEYYNNNGERMHLLACCCDCEALDQIGDRLIKCEQLPSSLIDKFVETLSDRCRIPGFSGRGAFRVSLEVATPVIVIPIFLMLGAFGPVSTFLVLCLLPYFCYFFYRTWKKKTSKTRTKFFFAWGVMSLFFMYLVFEIIVCRHANVSLLQNLLVNVGVVGMCISLKVAKTDPGLVQNEKIKQYLHKSFTFFGQSSVEKKGPWVENRTIDEDISDFEVIEHSDIQEAGDTSVEDEQRTSQKHVDLNRPSKGENWCGKCSISKPLRAGHCNMCDLCIHNRDHHCVWIDSCVGINNHRSFLVSMAICILTGYFGGILTLLSVCDPVGLSDILCPLHVAYRDYQWGLCYICCWYVIIISSTMLLGFIQQLLLISQNVTSHELHQAAKLGKVRYLIYYDGNPYNKGVIQNWSNFMLKRRAQMTNICVTV